MIIPARIRTAAETLKSGRRVNRVTVRDFLRHFGAERRGAVKVQEIRTILDELGLKTVPDFETEWIDAPIWLRLKDEQPAPLNGVSGEHSSAPPVGQQEVDVLDSTPSAVESADDNLQSAPTIVEDETPAIVAETPVRLTEDPTYRIGNLPAANKLLVTVNQNDPIAKAVTLMLQYDFSQLPVMQGDREVKGVITWKGIGSRFALNAECNTVGQSREDASVIDSDKTLFEAIPTIVDRGYVLVRARDRRITGIVTASDLSLQFQSLAEPFLLVREIELHIRRFLGAKISNSELASLLPPNPGDNPPQNIADLTFGEYLLLVQKPDIWNRLGLGVDRSVLVSALEKVRNIRNDIMHFDPDPLTEEDLRALKSATNLFQILAGLTPSHA